jgi:4-hydroxybenzoate polyprenyltransferase
MIIRGIKFFIDTNLLLSFATVFLAVATTMQLGLKPRVSPVLAVVFFATFLFYNISRIRKELNNKHDVNFGKSIRDRITVFNLLVLISVIGMAVCTMYLKAEVLLMLLFLAGVSLLYSVPSFKGIGNSISLRTIPYLKIFLITGIWAAVTVILPVLQSQSSPEKSEVIAVFSERFIFLFVIALLFDIKDMRPDKETGLKTIPLLLGYRKAMQLANGLLILFLISIILHYKSSLHFVLVSFIVSALSTFVLINNRKISTTPYFHRGIVDGTLLIQPLLVLIFYYLEKLM